jgi:NodT family efflux transporter outer membrane factor (OMF) lipoprotein
MYISLLASQWEWRIMTKTVAPKVNAALPILGAAWLLAGCAAGPNYVPPQMTLRPTFMGASASPAEARRETQGVEGSWWASFDDPLLADLIANALSGNLDIAQARARLRQASAGVRSANASLAPGLGLDASAAHARASLNGPDRALAGAPGFQRENDLFDVDVSASWELDLFGGLRREREAARSNAGAADAQLAGARITIAAEAARAYVGLRTLQERLRIAREESDVQRHLVELTRARYEGGVSIELDLRQAEALLQVSDARIPGLETGVEAALNRLDVLQGLAPGETRARFLSAGSIPDAPAMLADITPSDLLRRRPDVVAAERKLARATARIGVAAAEYYPHLTLGALLGQQSFEANSLFDAASASTGGLIGIHWRLFDFGRVDASVEAARGGADEALAAFRSTVLVASEEIENALVARANLERQLRNLDAAVAAASRSSAIARNAYQTGNASFLAVLEAERARLDAEDQRAVVHGEATVASITLYRAMGSGWSAPAHERSPQVRP